MGNLKKALHEYRQATSVQKAGHNPFFNSSYYQLEDLLNALKNSHEYGIYFCQYIAHGELFTEVEHEDDQMVSRSVLPEPTEKNHQEIAKQITYFRRIHLITMFGICEPDDDGNTSATASHPPIATAGEQTGGVSLRRPSAPSFDDDI